MARTRSTESLLNDLPIEAQIKAQGIRALVEARASQDVRCTNASEQLASDFIRWLRDERREAFDAALAEFALDLAKC